MDEQWWSIEVLDAVRDERAPTGSAAEGNRISAEVWRDSHGSFLVEAALTNGGRGWSWHHHTWGVVLEVCFSSEQAWEAFRASPAVRAAMDAVPDPVNGLLVYAGRGGGAGSRSPRRPLPPRGAAAPMPVVDTPIVVAGHWDADKVSPELAQLLLALAR
jgi:hypothetical protein